MEQGTDRGEDLDVYCEGGDSRSEKKERRGVALSVFSSDNYRNTNGSVSLTNDGDGGLGRVAFLTMRHNAGPLAAVSPLGFHFIPSLLHFLSLRVQPVDLRL